MFKLDARRSTSGTAPLRALRMADERRAATPPRGLSVEALKISSQPTLAGYSPIVLAGTVRLIEFTLTIVIGSAIYAAYVVPVEGLEWHYVLAILAIAVMSTLALQVADVYQVQAFRGHEKQYMRLASAWSVIFLIVIGISSRPSLVQRRTRRNRPRRNATRDKRPST